MNAPASTPGITEYQNLVDGKWRTAPDGRLVDVDRSDARDR